MATCSRPLRVLRDRGILHRLLDITTAKALLAHPRCGASWEGFAIEHILRRCDEAQAYFWATHAGAELDLLLIRGRRALDSRSNGATPQR